MTTIAAHRWLMSAPGVPLERVGFDAAPGPGEVVVAVAGCGVCHTDLGYYYDGVRTDAPLPLALGHQRQQLVDAFDAHVRGNSSELLGARRVLDLEHEARHRGSAFGRLAEPQPAQATFENSVAAQLLLGNETRLLLEDESRTIGRLELPE